MKTSTLGSRMQQAMAEEKISPAQLARDVGTSETTIGNWCKDRIQPAQAKAALGLRICRRLRIRMEWLIFNEEPMRAEVAHKAAILEPSEAEILQRDVDGLRVTLVAVAKTLAATIPTTGRALDDEFALIAAGAPDRDFLALLRGAVQRELASQESAGSHAPSRGVRGSTARKSAR